MKESFEVVLADFKAKAGMEDVLILFSEGPIYEMVRNVIVIWPKVSLERVVIKEDTPEDTNGRWIWLWKQVKYNPMEIAGKIGLTGILGPDKVMEIAIGNRMIFPDGTVSEYVLKAIRQLVAAKLGLTNRPKKR